MSATVPPLPALPGPDWTHVQSLETEAAIRAHMATHGRSVEALRALAHVLIPRCAYRPALALLEEALARAAGQEQPGTAANHRLTALSVALHGGLQEAAERQAAAIAGLRDIIAYEYAPQFVRLVRGTGLQPEVRRILERCLACIDPAAPEADVAAVLLREYEDTARIAAGVRLVSLGSGCYPWLQANRYMLRRVDAIDSLMPFNMNVAVEAGVVAALETGLAGFFEADAFDRTTMIRGIPVGRLRRYGILFNHDCDAGFLADDMAELRALCAARARAFLDHAVAGPRVFFYWDGMFADLHRLEAAVAGLMRDQDYRLLLVATAPGDLSGQPAPKLPTTRLVHVPMPHAGYNWTLEDHTPAGFRFDLAMRRAVRETMRELA